MAPPAAPRLDTAELDASCRSLLLLLFTSSLIWLVLAAGGLLIAFIELHAPAIPWAWLTYGRIRPAAMDALLYGFASQAALGAMLWMFCRLGGHRLLLPVIAWAGGCLWNFGVTIGVLGILAGFSTGFHWLEMPRSVFVLLLIAYALIGASAGVTFHFRRERSLYVSQWYLLAALFWFPWIYSAANLLLLFWPVRGTVQPVVNAWFANNFLGLWLTPVALAAIFYFIPKLLERPLYDWWLAVFGFWTLAFFSNWSGLTSLVGGPVPAWMISVSIAANVLLVVPVLATVLNWHLTARGAYRQLGRNWTLRYMAFGAGSYLAATLMGIVLGLREVSVYTNFTYARFAQNQLALWGFVAMTLLGAIHYIVPRLVQLPWPAKGVARHFWLSTSGIVLIFMALTVGGLLQAAKLNDASVPFVNVMKATFPFIGVATIGWLLLLAGQLLFLLHTLWLLRRYSAPFRKTTLAFFTHPPSTTPEVRP